MTDFDPRRALVRSHHGVTLPAAVAMIGVAIVLVGRRWTELPSMSGDTVQLQIWMILACGLATLPAALTDSELAELEQTATDSLRRHESLLLLVGVGIASATLAGAVWLRIGGDAALISLRIFATWLGFALLSSRTLGTSRFWILPGIALVTVTVTNRTPAPPWVQVVTGAPEHWPSLLCATAALALGAVAHYLTPWRLHALLSRTTSGAQ